MSIALQDYASGDTNYVAKLNSNNDVLESAIGALQAATSGEAGATLSLLNAYPALFGQSVALIGDDSYACSDAGSGDLNVAAGYCWRPSLTAVLSKLTATTLDFTGQTAATYYILIDSSGEPTRTTSSIEAIYSVVWTGSAFGAITRLAAVVWGAADWVAAQTSTVLGATYTSLDDRLEAAETGALARTFQTGRLSKSVAASGTVTLTAVEANNTLINLTGTLTATTNVIVPLGTNPRVFVVTNNTTGAFTLTVKGASGTGVVVATGATKLIYQDGTNFIDLLAATGAGAGTVTSVNVTAPAAGITASGGPVTSSGSITLALANDLSALEALSSTGFAKRTGTDAWSVGALVQADLPAQPYDVGGSYPTAPTASLVMLRYPVPRAVVFPASLTLSRGVAGTAATAQTDFDILKNGVSFATMRFAAAGTAASFISASGSTFAAGDILTVVAPASPDATLAGLGFSLAGTR